MKLSIFYSLVFSFVIFNLANAETSLDETSSSGFFFHGMKLLHIRGNLTRAEERDREEKDRSLSFMYAVEDGDIEAATYLMIKGIDVNFTSRGGDTPLMWASRKGHMQFVVQLIEEGADVNAINKAGKTALMPAVESGYLRVADKLIEEGADVNAINKAGKTVLMYAAESGHLGVVDKLIEEGADVSVTDALGETALMYAIKSGKSAEVIKALYYETRLYLSSEDLDEIRDHLIFMLLSKTVDSN